MTPPLLIAGPTASGKSDYALAEAAKGGVIINADASQVYGGWRILTARPSASEEAQADLIGMLERVAAAEGGVSTEQRAAIDNVRRRLATA